MPLLGSSDRKRTALHLRAEEVANEKLQGRDVKIKDSVSKHRAEQRQKGDIIVNNQQLLQLRSF
jgi:hypothetical protein